MSERGGERERGRARAWESESVGESEGERESGRVCERESVG